MLEQLKGLPINVRPSRPVSQELIQRAAALYTRLAPFLFQPEGFEPTADQMRFDAVVWLTYPIAGRQKVSTADQGAGQLFAENPASAARKWLWRLSVEEHAAVDRVIVCAAHPRGLRAVYSGPAVAFRREGTALVEIAWDDDGGCER